MTDTEIDPSDDFITPSELAELTGRARPTVSNWRKRYDDFPAPVAPNAPYYLKSEILRWLATHQIAVKVPTPEKALSAIVDDLRDEVPVDIAWLSVIEMLAAVATSRRSANQREQGNAKDVWPTSARLDLTAQAQERLTSRLQGLVANADPAALAEIAVEQFGLPAWGRGSLTSSPETGLTELLLDLVTTNLSRSLLDPACGVGGILMAAARRGMSSELGDSHFKLFGADRRPEVAAVAQARALAAGVHLDVRVGNPLDVDPFADLQVSCVTTIPPLGEKNSDRGMPGDSRWRFGSPFGRSEWAYMQQAISHLERGGRAAVATAHTTTHEQGSGARVRQELIRQGAVGAVIALPRGMLGAKGSPAAAIWILKRPDEQSSSDVLLIDATADQSTDAATSSRYQWVVQTYRQWQADPQQQPAHSTAVGVPAIELLAPGAVVDPVRWCAPRPEGGPQLVQAVLASVADLPACVEKLRLSIPSPPTVVESELRRISLYQLLDANQLQVIRSIPSKREQAGSDQAAPVQTAVIISPRTVDDAFNGYVDGLRTVPRPSPELLTEPGDILVYVHQQRIRARVCPVSGLAPGTLMHLLRLKDSTIDPHYLAAVIGSSWNAAAFSSFGDNDGVPDLRAILIPLAPLTMQRAAGQYLRALEVTADAARVAAQATQRAIWAAGDALGSGLASVVE